VVQNAYKIQEVTNHLALPKQHTDIRGGADKSLARPGRKQATATKLRIYSSYSLRSLIHTDVNVLRHFTTTCVQNSGPRFSNARKKKKKEKRTDTRCNNFHICTVRLAMPKLM